MSGKTIKNSEMVYRNPEVFMGIPGMSEYEIWQTDPEAVAAVRTMLDARQMKKRKCARMRAAV